MWNPGTITAIASAIVAVIGAITALLALFRHQSSPNAHVAVKETTAHEESERP